MKRFLATLLLLTVCTAVFPAVAQSDAPSVFSILWSGDEGQISALWQKLDASAQTQISPAVLMGLKEQLTQAYGDWKGNGEAAVLNQNGMTVSLMPVHFERMSLQFQLVTQDEKILGLAFTPLKVTATPAPVADEAIEEIEVTIGEGTAYPLPGTLTLPKEGTNLPLAVLVHGSGPNDRNETVGSVHMFRDLAEALARRGIATLRYDKRTLVYGSRLTADELRRFSAREETIDDAILAAKLAQKLERIDTEQVYVIGHSLGAMLSPRIVKDAEGLFKGMVLLCGSPYTLLDIMIDQNQAVVNSLEGNVKAGQQATLDKLVAEAEANLALSADELEGKTIFGQPAYYFWEMERFDTAEMIRQSGAPTLIINGGSDFQVTDENGIIAWQKALQGVDTVRMIHRPELNHMLMEYSGDPAFKGTVKEYDTPARLDSDAAKAIADWILEQE